MTRIDQPSDPTETPILNTPYDSPKWYWSLDLDFRACSPALPGRRPSGAYLAVPKPSKLGPALPLGDQQQSCQQIEPHRQINQIREAVQDWRDAGWPGATTETVQLLEHWNQPERDGVQPYFCQRDAVETAIFLREADDDRREEFNTTLREINADHNEGIPRIALKLATGTGKTLVMAMLILWQSKNGYCKDFLLFVPNLTIRARLEELTSGSPIYNDLRPAGDRTRFRVTVINFQAWQPRTSVGIEGTITEKQKKRMGLDPTLYREATTESEEEMIARLLAAHRGRNGLCILNDEAHHCYNGTRARGVRISGESAREESEAMMWFGALQALHQRGRVTQVYDLSATPMWLRRPTHKEPSVLFPWTVSDYPLVDAIEAGLVKIPRVPIRDESGSDLPAFRNLHTAVKNEIGNALLPDKGNPLPKIVEDALARMLADYNRIRQIYEARDITPVLIVVADTIKNAERLFAELGGWRTENGMWSVGRGVLSNVDHQGRIKSRPPTLLVHSRMDETDKDTKLAGNAEDSDNAAVHAPDDELTAVERMNIVRELFNTVGKPGELGEHLRCIVSVGMLTEGWDAKAVTHVVGYRNFGSDLLCEQVAGRALRRSVVPEPGIDQSAEYANIVGIPFLNMPAIEEGDPGRSKERWAVYTVSGRQRQRIELPRVQGWRRDQPGPHASLCTPLTPFEGRQSPGTGNVSLLGEGGEEVALTAQDAEREQTACWQLARKVLDRCKAEYDGDASLSRLESFASVVRAVATYLSLRNMHATQLTTDALVEAVSADIVKHLDWSDAPERIVATLDSPDRVSTAACSFETTLLRYPEQDGHLTRRSELNAAACHSEFEQQVANLLDHNEAVDAWVRNFRLGWTIPWHDPIHARWHDYEPDFIARVPLEGSGAEAGHLVIEVKGRPDVRSDEKARAAREWCQRLTNGAVAGVNGPWLYAMINQQTTMGADLAAAIGMLRGMTY